ncbi:hypothetical protein ACFL0Z_03030 [Patescibacteria group bacterium]
MNKQRTGVVLLVIGAVYMLAMGLIGSWLVRPTFRTLSLADANETIWAIGSPLFGSWAMSVPVGAIIAGIGVLIYIGAKRSHIWYFALGTFAVFAIDALIKWQVVPKPEHWSPLFGIGGALIVIFFIGILWFWAKKHVSLEGIAKTAAELQLTGYVFMMIAMWYLCGALALPYQKALLELPQTSPVMIIVFLVLGWFFLFLSHRASARLQGDPGS